jgi:hypothetical protein
MINQITCLILISASAFQIISYIRFVRRYNNELKYFKTLVNVNSELCHSLITQAIMTAVAVEDYETAHRFKEALHEFETRNKQFDEAAKDMKK